MLREDGFKFCKGCDEWKLAQDNFYKSKVARSDGFLTYCKTCEKARVIRYQKANPDKKKLYDHLTNQKETRKAKHRVTAKKSLERRLEADPERVKRLRSEAQQRHYYKDVEASREKGRRHYSKDIDHSREMHRKSASRPERLASITEQSHLRSALTRPHSFFENEDGQKICHRDWVKLLEVFDNACAYCDGRSELEIDHVMPKHLGGKNALGNLVPSCKKCNSLKGRKHPELFCPDRLADILSKANIEPYLK